MNNDVHPTQPEFNPHGEAYEVPTNHGEGGYFAQWERPINVPQGQIPAHLDPASNVPAFNAEVNMHWYSSAQNLKTAPQASFHPEISEGDRLALNRMRQHISGMNEVPVHTASKLLAVSGFHQDGTGGYFDSLRAYGDARYRVDGRSDVHTPVVDPLYQGFVVPSDGLGVSGFMYPRDTGSFQNYHQNPNRCYESHQGGLRNSDPGIRGSYDNDLRNSVDSDMRGSFDSNLCYSYDNSSIGSTARTSVFSVPTKLTNSVTTAKDYFNNQWTHLQEPVSHVAPKQGQIDLQNQALPMRPALWPTTNDIQSAPEVMTTTSAWKLQPLTQTTPFKNSNPFSSSPNIYQGRLSPNSSKSSQENYCPDQACQFHNEGFKFRWLLRRHICNHHLKSYNSGRSTKCESDDLTLRFLSLVYVCPVAECSRAFYRLDSLLRHQKLIHSQAKEESRRSIKVRMSPPEDIFE